MLSVYYLVTEFVLPGHFSQQSTADEARFVADGEAFKVRFYSSLGSHGARFSQLFSGRDSANI